MQRLLDDTPGAVLGEIDQGAAYAALYRERLRPFEGGDPALAADVEPALQQGGGARLASFHAHGQRMQVGKREPAPGRTQQRKPGDAILAMQQRTRQTGFTRPQVAMQMQRYARCQNACERGTERLRAFFILQVFSPVLHPNSCFFLPVFQRVRYFLHP